MCYWYRPDELPERIVLVTVAGTFSGVFSGLLAFAFNGVTTGGLSGWKWYATMRQGLSSRVQVRSDVDTQTSGILEATEVLSILKTSSVLLSDPTLMISKASLLLVLKIFL